jgi:hypothetical protein
MEWARRGTQRRPNPNTIADPVDMGSLNDLVNDAMELSPGNQSIRLQRGVNSRKAAGSYYCKSFSEMARQITEMSFR